MAWVAAGPDKKLGLRIAAEVDEAG